MKPLEDPDLALARALLATGRLAADEALWVEAFVRVVERGAPVLSVDRRRLEDKAAELGVEAG